MTDRRIAARLSRGIAEDAARLLSVVALPDARVLGLCRSCPKRTRDIRGDRGGELSTDRGRNYALSTGFIASSVEEVEAWFDAHRRTDIHSYYLAPTTRPASEEERRLAQIFGEQPPAAEVVPFRYARKGMGPR